ncbi:cupin domain-containing protein [Mesorhizobium sp. Cs1299R1N1]|uniref:cupin domain-containing protein n=1 Tax=Mesorhizobium sp. Cs1299R1N1 TaxID=3015172 RepID=UPI003FA61123
MRERGAGEWPYTTAGLEFCQILSGHGSFVPEGGEPIPLNSGDVILFYPRTAGRWIVVETLKELSLALPNASYL